MDGMSVTDRQLEDALRSAARVIDRYGDVYWPLFERLEQELAAWRSRTARLSAYLSDNGRAERLAVRPRLVGMDVRSSEAHRV